MKKSLILSCVCLFCVCDIFAQTQDGFLWKDATELAIGGKITTETITPYSRFPQSMKGKANEKVWGLGQCSSGLYVKFRTASPEICIKWSLAKAMGSSVMSRVNYMGLDLYYWTGERWQFAYPCKPGSKADQVYETKCVFDRLPNEEREYLLYLSMYNSVKTLEIGVKDGFSLEASAFNNPDPAKPIIMYGTSILMGGSASRPGLASTNRLSRSLGRVVINLGFAGNGRLHPEIAEYMASYPDPGVYVLDNLPNCPEKLIVEKQEMFFRILRKAHPDVPVVFIENPIYPKTMVSNSEYKRFAPRNQALRKVFDSLVASGEKNIYYISAENLLDPEGEGTIDGVHFNDIGFSHYISVVHPVLKSILESK